MNLIQISVRDPINTRIWNKFPFLTSKHTDLVWDETEVKGKSSHPLIRTLYFPKSKHHKNNWLEMYFHVDGTSTFF